MSLNDREHWENFYGAWDLLIPSQFCAMVALDLAPGDQVVEFGCGNGRDATCFAGYGAKVLAFDSSRAAIQKARSLSSALEFNPPQFQEADVLDASKIIQQINDWRSKSRTLFYTRFFLHSIDEARQEKVMAILSSAMRSGDRGYCEFRTPQDASKRKEFGQHYRRYVDTADFRRAIEQVGLTVTYEVEGNGMAVFRGEDATVGRVVFECT